MALTAAAAELNVRPLGASRMEQRWVVRNDTGQLMLVFVEPEGWDCWLRPGEVAELRADGPDGTGFVVTDTRDGVTVWPDCGLGAISAWVGGREVSAGHQRPQGWPR